MSRACRTRGFLRTLRLKPHLKTSHAAWLSNTPARASESTLFHPAMLPRAARSKFSTKIRRTENSCCGFLWGTAIALNPLQTHSYFCAHRWHPRLTGKFSALITAQALGTGYESRTRPLPAHADAGLLRFRATSRSDTRGRSFGGLLQPRKSEPSRQSAFGGEVRAMGHSRRSGKALDRCRTQTTSRRNRRCGTCGCGDREYRPRALA